MAALERYLYDPVHLDGDFGILPISRNRLSDDMDPELNGKIVAMHLKKVATYPQWGHLLDAIPNKQIPSNA